MRWVDAAGIATKVIQEFAFRNWAFMLLVDVAMGRVKLLAYCYGPISFGVFTALPFPTSSDWIDDIF
jgi:hypothetical protein